MKIMADRRTIARRPAMMGIIALLTILLGACGTESLLDTEPVIPGPDAPLVAADVTSIVRNAALAVEGTLSIAVTDRAGNVLGVFSRPDPGSGTSEEGAVSLARTASFFSNDQAPLSSRTVGFISRENFPGFVKNTPSAALFGIENTNRGCDLTSAGAAPYLPGQALPQATNIPNTAPGSGVTTRPGGIPLFRNGRLIGGIGVVADTDDSAEFAALSGSSGFEPSVPAPGRIFIDGIELPFAEATEVPSRVGPGSFPGTGAFRAGFGAIPSGNITAPFVPEGYLIGPVAGTRLTISEVDSIVQNCIVQAGKTRAAIRLPLGSRTRMAIAVCEGAAGATQGQLLALYRMADATVFSVDVAASKSRNVVYFSSTSRFAGDLPLVPVGTAVTNRTIGYGAQSFFPSGIPDSGPGPFRGLFDFDTQNPCTQGIDPGGTFPAANKSGVVFFPGSAPLYKGGVLVGGLGVSGDGVEQDDVVTAAGAEGYLPDPSIRADQIVIDNVRLPYFKFSRNPEE